MTDPSSFAAACMTRIEAIAYDLCMIMKRFNK